MREILFQSLFAIGICAVLVFFFCFTFEACHGEGIMVIVAAIFLLGAAVIGIGGNIPLFRAAFLQVLA